MTALPVIEMIARQFRWSGIPGSAVIVQQLTLWIGMLGGMLASRSGRLLGLSSSSFLPESWIAPAKIFWSAALAAVSTCLAYASWVFVQSERAVRQLSTPRPSQMDRACHHAGRLCRHRSARRLERQRRLDWPRDRRHRPLHPRTLRLRDPHRRARRASALLRSSRACHRPRPPDLRRLRRPGAACSSGAAARPLRRSR